MLVHNVLIKYNQIMRKLLIFTFCLVLASCAGTRTLDGETTKNWVKIVSSKIDKAGNIQDVCFLLDLSFYPGSVYDRIKNNPNMCLDECCWYSENKTVDYYFNDGFLKELKETGTARRYYPDHIRIKMNFAPFLNRLSAKAESYNGISKNGVVTLEYDDVVDSEMMNNEGFYDFEAKAYPEDPKDPKAKKQEDTSYKTISMSGLNRDELLARAKNEQSAYYKKEIALRYESPEKEFVEESIEFTGQVSPFDPEDKETKWITNKKTLEEEAKSKEYNAYPERYKYKYHSKLMAKRQKRLQKQQEQLQEEQKQLEEKQQAIYDVQRTPEQQAQFALLQEKAEQEASKIEKTTEEKLEEARNLELKLTYERTQAVNLLKRFYGDEIDGYLRALDKEKRQEGQILFTNDKVWQAKKVGTTIYTVNCNVKGKIIVLGAKSGTKTKDYPVACGTFLVNLDEKTVEAKDDTAKKIAQKKY